MVGEVPVFVGVGDVVGGVGDVVGEVVAAGALEDGLVDGVGEALRDGVWTAPISASVSWNLPVSTPLRAARVYARQMEAGKLEPPARPRPAVPVRVTWLWVVGSSPNIATTVTSSGVYPVNQAATLDSVVPVLPPAS